LAKEILMAKVLAENRLYVDSHLSETITSRELHCQFIHRFREKFPELNLNKGDRYFLQI
jgi:hypothetical protein